MTMTYGPYITKTVETHCFACGQVDGVKEVLDEDAYWWLDVRTGEEVDGEHGIGYSKAAWPTVRAAQQEWQRQRRELENERAVSAKRRRPRKQGAS